MSVGMPAVVWSDAQGYLDVVEGLWPPGDGGASALLGLGFKGSGFRV